MNVQQKTKGFTIIEVVLVLAIAGLIFLMVFIALPALQRSQRDSARKNEVGTVVSAIQSYQSNNRNAIPTAASIVQYVGGTGTNLDSGTAVSVSQLAYTATTLVAALGTSVGASGNTLYDAQIKIFFGSKCPDPNSNAPNDLVRGTTKEAAVVTALESGPSTGSIYCQAT